MSSLAHPLNVSIEHRHAHGLVLLLLQEAVTPEELTDNEEYKEIIEVGGFMRVLVGLR